ncbi:enoyl-CoA hydratase-related protein [Desulfothermus okinawensis JCM 13304]
MEYKNIIVEKTEDFLGIITLNRPNNLNTFTVELAKELKNSLEDMDKDQKVRVIIIKGAGRAFCAGIDVGDFFDKSTKEYREWIEIMESPLVYISQMNKPVIAQVHGPAVANGLGVVAACDLAIASKNSKFGLTAINVGLNCVGPVIPVLRSIGRKRSLELLFLGNTIDAEEAQKIGLINRAVDPDKLEEETLKIAKELAKKSPIALQIAKKAFYVAEDMDYLKSFNYMNEVFARLCSTEDAKEGVRAFLEKRTPEWKEK